MWLGIQEQQKERFLSPNRYLKDQDQSYLGRYISHGCHSIDWIAVQGLISHNRLFCLSSIAQLEEHGSCVRLRPYLLCWYRYAVALIFYLQLTSKVKIKYESSICTFSPENQLYTGLHENNRDQQLREEVLPLYFALVRPHLDPVSSSGPPTQEKHWPVREVQGGTTKNYLRTGAPHLWRKSWESSVWRREGSL